MEFFYIPGKDSSHSHWVQYEAREELNVSKSEEGMDVESALKDSRDALKEAKKQDKLFNLFKFKSGTRDKEDTKKAAVKNTLSSQEFNRQAEYKLRQQLTCPYDGYVFFPEGDLLDQTRFKPKNIFYEEPSNIESSFSKAISFGAPKDLKQFGYELFFIPEKEKKDEKEGEESQAADKSIESLAALGMLKTALGGQGAQGTGFSSQV